jgi:exopolyphosphatase/pppGpp-phosphohydrolase
MPGINHMAIELLQQLAQFQHRAKEKDPLNAKSKKRLVH